MNFSKFQIQCCDWLDLLSLKIINDLYSKQQAVIFLLNSTKLLVEHNIFIQLIYQKYPHFIKKIFLTINEEKERKTPLNRMDIRTLRRSIRKEQTIYIILSHATDKESELKALLRILNLPGLNRKCLIVYFHENIYSYDFGSIMKYAWKQKYLPRFYNCLFERERKVRYSRNALL